MIRTLLCFYLLLFGCGILHAQQKADQVIEPIAAKMEWYQAKKKPATLFVHFDKNIYAPGEYVWFTAYLLASQARAGTHHTLAVALLRNDDSAALTDHKFVMSNGLGFGHLQLPDTLRAGNYSLVAFTNALWNGKPETYFIQPITIKTQSQSIFTATLKLAEKTAAGDSATLAFKASAKDIRTLASFTEVSYSLGGVQKKLKTDMYGTALFKVPLTQTDTSINRLRLKAVFRNETKQMQIRLPVANEEPRLKFFPEGGSVVANTAGTIGWEARDAYGQPIAISGVLFRNNNVVDTIQTNGYGMGRFSIRPKEGEQYHVKLFRSGVLSGHYALPAVAPQPLSLSVPKAVCKDTLLFYTEAPLRGVYYALVHDYTGLFFSFVVDMSASSTRRFRVPLDKMPRGVQALTIVDEKGRPLAERLFFAHYNRRAQVEIATDKTQYKTREEVKLDISLNDPPADSVNGFVSVACVQESRIDLEKMTDIESYVYLDGELNHTAFKRSLMHATEESLQHWEDLLLIKGWRRYTWQDLAETTASDTVQTFSELIFAGNITSKKKITKPIDISLVSNESADVFTTDGSGRFVLAPERLVSEPGRKLFLTVGGKNQLDYTVNLEDPYLSVVRKLCKIVEYNDAEAFVTEKNSETLVLKRSEGAEVLAEVTVQSSKRKDAFLDMIRPGRNLCGDYVCSSGVLNCVNHHTGVMPVKGRMYRLPPDGNRIKKYLGCLLDMPAEKDKNPLTAIPGIYTAKEFYKIDYSQLAPTETALQTTIFWDYAVPVQKGKPASLTFLTSDIEGRFRIVIQGVTSKGVIHEEQVFSVVK